jgi:hypothetical protein
MSSQFLNCLPERLGNSDAVVYCFKIGHYILLLVEDERSKSLYKRNTTHVEEPTRPSAMDRAWRTG